MATRRKAGDVVLPKCLVDDERCRAKVVELARSLADGAARRLAATMVEFLKNIAVNPSYALRWNVGDIPKLKAESKTWDTAVAFLSEKAADDPPAGLRGILEELEVYARGQLDRILEFQSWNQNSTSPWANLVDVGEVNGKVEAWRAIREFASWGIAEISRGTGPQAGGNEP